MKDEHVDDIVYVERQGIKIKIAEDIDRHLGNRGHHQGLRSGTMAMVGLSYIFSRGNHRPDVGQLKFQGEGETSSWMTNSA